MKGKSSFPKKTVRLKMLYLYNKLGTTSLCCRDSVILLSNARDNKQFLSLQELQGSCCVLLSHTQVSAATKVRLHRKTEHVPPRSPSVSFFF